MSFLDSILSWPPISRVRRNHALEHATLQILARKTPDLSAAGYSDTNGFWIIGQVNTEALEQSVTEAAARLRAGEHRLAIHPNCGTNFVAAGVVAGSLAWLGMVFNHSGVRRNLERLPLLISLVTVGIIVAQPLGPLLQARVTVNPNIGGLKVTEIARLQRTDAVIHRVRTVN
jgi:hypothetical protein